MIVTLPHPTAKQVRMMGVPIRLHGTPGRAKLAPPLLGQHTEAVLKSVLGMKKPAIARLRAAGVI
jgi:formyl-CoA transferase